MKKGFTLPELLITLGLVGVVAAFALPAISNIMPNQDKIMFLKAYNTVTKFAQEVATNHMYYDPTREGYDEDGNYLCQGLCKCCLTNTGRT